MKHFIGRQTFRVTRSHKREVLAMQQTLSNTFWDEVVPAFKRLFDEIVGETAYLYIDKLEIDLGTISEKDLYTGAWIQTLLTKTNMELVKAKHVALQKQDASYFLIRSFEKWLYFLKNGRLPRLSPTPDTLWHQQVLDTLALESSSVQRLRELLTTDSIARKRMILQHPNSFLVSLTELLTAQKQRDLLVALEEMRKGLLPLMHLNWLKQDSSTKKSATLWEYFNGDFSDKSSYQDYLKKLKGQRKTLESAAQASESLLWVNIPSQVGEISHVEDRDTSELVSSSRSIKKRIQDVRKLFLQRERELEVRFWEKIFGDLVHRGSTSRPQDLVKHIFEEAADFRALGEFFSVLESKEIGEFIYLKPILSTLKDPKPQRKPSSLRLPQKLYTSIREESETLSIPYYKEEDSADGRFIPTAGMVLLHPFISQLFKKLGWTDGMKFSNPLDANRAAHLLHYLATGEDRAREYELSLPKLLCGIPWHKPLDAELVLGEEEKEEGLSLLKAVIEHWGALGNASPDGLREGFLIREGKLAKGNSGWQLKVERKTMDLLLNQLPWGLGLVKYSWMKEPLFVEWN